MQAHARDYAPSEYQQVRHAEYYRSLSTKHLYYQPRLRYQSVPMPAPIAAKLTKYAKQLVDRA